MNSPIYLDNNATTRVHPAVLEAMLPWLGAQFGNASSKHSLGQLAKAALMDARAQVAALINAHPAEIVFTSGATESNQTAIHSALATQPGKRHIVATAVEHHSVLGALEALSRNGIDVSYVPVDASGMLDINALREALREDTALVTVMHANNETGVLFPLQEIAALCQARHILLHVDAAQTVGKMPVDCRQLNCDTLSFSGHKFHAPQGIGVLYVRKGTPFQPLLVGNQERKRRAGTENLPTIIGLGAAATQALVGMKESMHSMAELRDALQNRLMQALPCARLNGTATRVPSTCNIRFEGLQAEELLERLDRAGVIASSGSACVTGSSTPSHVLLAMGLSTSQAQSSVRFSLSRETTAEQVASAAETMIELVGIMTEHLAVLP